MQNPHQNSQSVNVAIMFLIFITIFIWFRTPIGNFCTTVLSITREIQTLDSEEDSSEENPDNKKKIKRKKWSKVPTVSKLPKTKSFYIPILSEKPEVNTAKLVTLPEMRIYNGKQWKKEKTSVKMGIFENNLYLFINCSDKHPEKIVTTYAKNIPKKIWQDDSIEIFLMKDKNADSYCQYLISPSGINYCYLMETIPDRVDKGTEIEKPEDFILPEIKAVITDKGYIVKGKISLQNIGIEQNSGTGSLLMQMVRNYRELYSDQRVNLQLYPTFIYADNRFNQAINHNRKGFQEVKILRKK